MTGWNVWAESDIDSGETENHSEKLQGCVVSSDSNYEEKQND